MSETTINKQIMLAVGGMPDTRLFRNNTGMAWQGKILDHSNGILVLKDPRPIHFGLGRVGSSDLIGWHTVTITPEMIGRPVAVFLAIEGKDKTTLTQEQKNFIVQVQYAGGISGVAHGADEAREIIRDWEMEMRR